MNIRVCTLLVIICSTYIIRDESLMGDDCRISGQLAAWMALESCCAVICRVVDCNHEKGVCEKSKLHSLL